MNYYRSNEPEIIWITEKSQLNTIYTFSPQLPFIFAKYSVVDKTCDKIVKKFASLKRAEARQEKQLAYKKHSNCNVVIEEFDLMDELTIKLENVLGTEANRQLWNRNYWQKRNYDGDYEGDNVDPDSAPILGNLVTIDKNINLKVTIEKIEADKNIIKKDGNPMRLTKLIVKDETGSSGLTLFDCNFADEFKEGIVLQLDNAVVNYRKYQDSADQGYPDGLKIPSWGSIKIMRNEN